MWDERGPALAYLAGLLRLNATAQAVVAHCDGQATVTRIMAALGEAYEVSAETLRADVFECLGQFDLASKTWTRLWLFS